MNTAITFCRDLVERHDRNRYILSLGAPAALRPALWAVLAFNHEISKTRDVTSDPITGHIRLSWWRDALTEEKYDHEILNALRPVIHKHDLPMSLFVDLIDARMRDVDNTPPPDLEEYAAQTNMPLAQICARILNAPEDTQTLYHLSVAYGMTGLLRGMRYFIHHDDHILPDDVLENLGVAPEQFSHIKQGEKLSNAVRHIGGEIESHLQKTAPVTKLFRMQIKMTVLYLNNLRRAGYDPFDPHYGRDIPFMGIRVWL